MRSQIRLRREQRQSAWRALNLGSLCIVLFLVSLAVTIGLGLA